MAYFGIFIVVPSTSRNHSSMPMTPPQVRAPTTGPSPRMRSAAAIMSPSEPANSSVSATTGPRGTSCGYVAAAVLAHVKDEHVPCHLGPQIAVEVGPALAHHVRDMEVARPPIGQLAHLPPVAGDPVLVPQAPLAGE